MQTWSFVARAPSVSRETALPQFDGAGGGQLWMLAFFGVVVLLLCVALPPSAHCVISQMDGLVEIYLVRTEWLFLVYATFAVALVFAAAFPAAVVRAATLFVSFMLVCFQFFECDDGGLGPQFPKLSGLALLAAMVLLLPIVLHWNLGREFFRQHSTPEKCPLIGAQNGRNEGKDEEDKSSSPSYLLSSLQVCSGGILSAAASAVALLSLFEVCARLGAAAASAVARESAGSGSGILVARAGGRAVHACCWWLRTGVDRCSPLKRAVCVCVCVRLRLRLGAAALGRLTEVMKACLTAAFPAAAFTFPEGFCSPGPGDGSYDAFATKGAG